MHSTTQRQQVLVQVRLINVGKRVPNPHQLLNLKIEKQQRDVAALKLRSRPLIECNERYISEIVPTWQNSPPCRSAHLSPPQSPKPGSLPEPHHSLAGLQGLGSALQPGAGHLAPAPRSSSGLSELRAALRTAEQRKVARDVKLRQQGISIDRKLPCEVCTCVGSRAH